MHQPDGQGLRLGQGSRLLDGAVADHRTRVVRGELELVGGDESDAELVRNGRRLGKQRHGERVASVLEVHGPWDLVGDAHLERSPRRDLEDVPHDGNPASRARSGGRALPSIS